MICPMRLSLCLRAALVYFGQTAATAADLLVSKRDYLVGIYLLRWLVAEIAEQMGNDCSRLAARLPGTHPASGRV